MSVNQTVGFIGAGMMAEALAKGFVSKGVIQANQVFCHDPSSARQEVFRAMGANPCQSGEEVCQKSEILFVATKPQYVKIVLAENKATLANKLVVSIAAGVTCATLLEALAKPDAKVIRVMPNTPCLVGATAAAMCAGGGTGASDIALIKTLFDAVGLIEVVDEKLLSAVTGVSGSGPAYVYMIIEAMSDGGVRAGLPRAVATKLAAQTLFGGAKMVLEKGLHPGQLKDEVTSPGGTTIAGVHSLESSGIRAAMIDAVMAACNRADELSKL